MRCASECPMLVPVCLLWIWSGWMDGNIRAPKEEAAAVVVVAVAAAAPSAPPPPPMTPARPRTPPAGLQKDHALARSLALPSYPMGSPVGLARPTDRPTDRLPDRSGDREGGRGGVRVVEAVTVEGGRRRLVALDRRASERAPIVVRSP